MIQLQYLIRRDARRLSVQTADVLGLFTPTMFTLDQGELEGEGLQFDPSVPPTLTPVGTNLQLQFQVIPSVGSTWAQDNPSDATKKATLVGQFDTKIASALRTNVAETITV